MSGCEFSGVKPAVMDLPYPPVQVREKNQNYADLIAISYCGMVSEMSAIMQYINNENRIFHQNCQMGKAFLGMAMAEMMHMQMLGQLVCLLGVWSCCNLCGSHGGMEHYSSFPRSYHLQIASQS